MKANWIKIKKEKYQEMERDNDKNISDYFKAKDENDILKVRIEEYKIGAERVIETLIDEIRNLKIILAGAVCKNNPFVDKEEVENILTCPSKHFSTP